eukprot:153213-Prymnesium_polylepis.1
MTVSSQRGASPQVLPVWTTTTPTRMDNNHFHSKHTQNHITPEHGGRPDPVRRRGYLPPAHDRHDGRLRWRRDA